MTTADDQTPTPPPEHEPTAAAPAQATPEAAAEETKPKLLWTIIGAVVVIIVAGIIADSFVTAHRDNGPQKLANGTYDSLVWGPAKKITSREEVKYLARRMPTDPFAIGNIDAPVTVVEFSDFECPFCAEFANDVEPKLIKDYVDTGKVRIEWNDFPVNGKHAFEAARAGRAAAEQGRFDQFRTALYAASKNVHGHPGNTMKNFVEFAKKAGVPDIEKFKKDAASSKYDKSITDSARWAAQIGISGTPTLIIGNHLLDASYPKIKAAIDEELKAIADGKVTPTKPGKTDGRTIPDLLKPLTPPPGGVPGAQQPPAGKAPAQKAPEQKAPATQPPANKK